MAANGAILLDAQGVRRLDPQGRLSHAPGCGCGCLCACVKRPPNEDGSDGGPGRPGSWTVSLGGLQPPAPGFPCGEFKYAGGNVSGTYTLNPGPFSDSGDAVVSHCYWGVDGLSCPVALSYGDKSVSTKLRIILTLTCVPGSYARIHLDVAAPHVEAYGAGTFSRAVGLFLSDVTRVPADSGQPWVFSNKPTTHCNTAGTGQLRFTGGSAVATPNFTA